MTHPEDDLQPCRHEQSGRYCRIDGVCQMCAESEYERVRFVAFLRSERMLKFTNNLSFGIALCIKRGEHLEARTWPEGELQPTDPGGTP